MLSLVLATVAQNSPTIVKIVKTAPTPTKELTVLDIILPGLGLTGAILLIGLLVGLVLGGAFIWFKKLRPLNPMNGQASQTHGLHLDRADGAVHSSEETFG